MSRLNWDFGSPVGNGAVASLPSLGGVAFFVLMSRRPGEGLAMGRRFRERGEGVEEEPRFVIVGVVVVGVGGAFSPPALLAVGGLVENEGAQIGVRRVPRIVNPMSRQLPPLGQPRLLRCRGRTRFTRACDGFRRFMVLLQRLSEIQPGVLHVVLQRPHVGEFERGGCASVTLMRLADAPLHRLNRTLVAHWGFFLVHSAARTVGMLRPVIFAFAGNVRHINGKWRGDSASQI